MNAIQKIIEQAIERGIDARINLRPGAGHRKHHPMGSTWSPPKPIILNGENYSISGARQYISGKNRGALS